MKWHAQTIKDADNYNCLSRDVLRKLATQSNPQTWPQFNVAVVQNMKLKELGLLLLCPPPTNLHPALASPLSTLWPAALVLTLCCDPTALPRPLACCDPTALAPPLSLLWPHSFSPAPQSVVTPQH